MKNAESCSLHTKTFLQTTNKTNIPQLKHFILFKVLEILYPLQSTHTSYHNDEIRKGKRKVNTLYVCSSKIFDFCIKSSKYAEPGNKEVSFEKKT